jgi:hypothetical protein
LVEPSGSLFVKKVLITNDLSEPVLDEAIKKDGYYQSFVSLK